MIGPWLRKQRAFGKIDNEQYHWTFGRFEGYPDCCIKNFVNLSVKLRTPAGSWMEENLGEDKPEDVGYVRCVLCRERK